MCLYVCALYSLIIFATLLKPFKLNALKYILANEKQNGLYDIIQILKQKFQFLFKQQENNENSSNF